MRLQRVTANERGKTMTHTYIIGSSLFFHDKAFQNLQDKNGNTIDRCVLCARKVGDNSFYVETMYGAEIIAFGTGNQSDAGYSGCFRIGSECARKIAPQALGRL